MKKIVMFLIRRFNLRFESFEHFDNEIKKLADGRYYSIRIGKSTHDNENTIVSFESYIDGYSWNSGSSVKNCVEATKANLCKNNPIILT